MIDKYGFDDFGRPSKPLYFMNLCFEIAKRSLDPHTKCGAIITDNSGAILSTGYNSPPMGSLDMNIPKTSTEKYDYFEHAERNAIYLASRRGVSLENSIFYVTGLPCMECLRGIIQVGANKVIYGPLTASMTDGKYLNKYSNLLFGHKIIVQMFLYTDGLIKMNPGVEETIKDRNFIDIQKYVKGPKYEQKKTR